MMNKTLASISILILAGCAQHDFNIQPKTSINSNSKKDLSGSTGLVTTISAGTLYIGGEDGNLYALDAATGGTKWSSNLGSYSHKETPTADFGGNVYVNGTDGITFSVKAATGTLNWADTTYGNRTTPTLYKDRLLVSGDGTHSGGTSFGLYALDIVSGKIIWKACKGLASVLSSPVVAQVGKQTLVFVSEAGGSTSTSLFALDFLTGNLVWTAAVGGYNSGPALVNGVIYIGGQIIGSNALKAFDAATGTLLWATPMANAITSSPTVYNGTVYVGCEDSNLYAFDAVTGSLKWLGITSGIPIDSSPIVDKGVVFIGGLDYNLYAFDAATGVQKWVSLMNSGIFSSPVVVNGVVYVGCLSTSSSTGGVRALDASTGALLWSALVGIDIRSSPCVQLLGTAPIVFHPGISGEQQ